MATKSTTAPQFTSTTPIDRAPSQNIQDGWFGGWDDELGKAEFRASELGTFTHPLAPSPEVGLLLGELSSACSNVHASIERARLLESKAKDAQRAAIDAVREATISGTKAEGIVHFDLETAKLAASGEVAGLLVLAQRAHDAVEEAHQAAWPAYLDMLRSNLSAGHAAAQKAVREATRTIQEVYGARAVLAQAGERFNATPVALDKLTKAAGRLALDVEASGVAFEIDTTPPPPVCFPPVAERKAIAADHQRIGVGVSERGTALWHIERSEGFEFTSLTKHWPEPPKESARGTVGTSWHSREDREALVATAAAIGGTEGTAPIELPEPAAPLMQEKVAAAMAPVVHELESRELLTGSERPAKDYAGSTVAEAARFLPRPTR